MLLAYTFPTCSIFCVLLVQLLAAYAILHLLVVLIASCTASVDWSMKYRVTKCH